MKVFTIVALLLVFTLVYAKGTSFTTKLNDPLHPTSQSENKPEKIRYIRIYLQLFLFEFFFYFFYLIVFSWSYWVLYGSIATSFLNSILYCFTPLPKRKLKQTAVHFSDLSSKEHYSNDRQDIIVKKTVPHL